MATQRKPRRTPTENTEQWQPPPAPPDEGGHTLQPHDTEAEQAVLGAMLLTEDAASIAAGMLSAEDFYLPQLGHVFTAIVNLTTKQIRADPITVADELRRAGLLDSVGGPGELVALAAGTPTSYVDRYARIVADHSVMRRMIGAANEISIAAYAKPDNVDDALDRAQQMLVDIVMRRQVDQPTRLGEAILPWIESMGAKVDNPAQRGIRCGLHPIDMRLGGGFKPGKVYVVAARPGVGKSVLLTQLAGVAAHRERVVHLANVEMSRDEILERIVAQMGIEAHHLTAPSKATDFVRVGSLARTVRTWPIRVVDVGQQSPQRIIADARKTRRDENGRLDLLCVDYLQQLHIETRRNGTRDQAIGEAMYLFKAAARDLNVPIVIAVQLSRLAEKDNRRPRLSDLRESGAIEQAADVVMALHEPASKGRRLLPYREVIFLKNRSGPQGIVKVGWVPSRTLLVNAARLTDIPEPPPDPQGSLLAGEPF